MKQRKVLNTGYVRLEEQPTQSVRFTFHIKAPLFVYNSFNEPHLGSFKRVHSSHLEFYTPPYFYDQAGQTVPNEVCNQLYTKLQNFHIWVYNFYRKLSEFPVHPQHFEIVLPQTLFTEFSLQLNIVDFQKFLASHRDSNSPEVHQYLQVMVDLLAEHTPWTSEFLK